MKCSVERLVSLLWTSKQHLVDLLDLITLDFTTSSLVAMPPQAIPASAVIPKPDPPGLITFSWELGTVAERLTDILEYAKSPRDHLRKKLGEETFGKRESLMSLPEEAELTADVYGSGGHKEPFEKRIAQNTFGKKHGLFFFTGVQTQLSSCKVYADRAGRNIVAWHHESHLENHEAQSFAELYRLQRLLLGSSAKTVPTVEDVKALTSLPLDKRPAVIVLELPNRELGCRTYTFPDLVAISDLCRDAGVALHCDGARIWEIEPYYRHHDGKGFKEIAALFDSLYCSFYKGLQGVAGSMLVTNDEEHIKQAKIWQRRAGGNAFTTWQETIDCERGFNTNIGRFDGCWKKILPVAEAVRERTSHLRTPDGHPIVAFEPTVPTCCQVQTHFRGATAETLGEARDAVIEKLNVRLMRTTGRPIFDEPQDGKLRADMPCRHFATEWMIYSGNIDYDWELIASAFVLLAEEIAKRIHREA
ncbi:hypothetical protein HKX48_004496 [Thoreauomyces humboldtii]|nr:hypothetical protein HKX48_004496 [Thoreauomyces humboldtii]